jgi:Glycosyl transferase family 2
MRAVSEPTVSVVMSVYNGEAFLREAADSILNQTYRDFEFIIIDDGSTDRTSAILAGYASRDTRVRALRHENKGRAESLNIGIGLAKGKYIARMDADDVALPLRLEKQVEFMERNEEVGLLCGAFELMSAKGETIKTVRPPIEDSEIKTVLERYNPLCHPAVMMRKEVVLATGGYRRALVDVDDYDLWLRISERSRLASFSEVVLRYRMHAGQVSVRKMGYQAECLFAARAAALRRRRGEPDPLANVEEITPQLLAALGVTEREIQQHLAGVYEYCMGLFGDTEPGASLQITGEVLRRCTAEVVGRNFLANAWLAAAGIHYRQGRPVRALVFSGRALLVRPLVAGRPLKRALTRLVAGFRG